MAAPTIKELELLEEFRNRLQDLKLNEYLNSDMELLRWIRAREHNLDQAELMFRKHMTWREEVNFDEIDTWELPKQCQELLPEEIIGFDDGNSPVLLTLFGKWDLKSVIQQLGAEVITKTKWKMFASTKQMMRGKMTPEGVPVTQISTIYDMDGLSISQATVQVLRTISDYARGFEANFPEFLKTCTVINAPRFFPIFYKCLKPFLSQKTKNKIRVYGKNQEEWKEFLQRQFPVQVLPTKYGGSNDLIVQ